MRRLRLRPVVVVVERIGVLVARDRQHLLTLPTARSLPRRVILDPKRVAALALDIDSHSAPRSIPIVGVPLASPHGDYRVPAG